MTAPDGFTLPKLPNKDSILEIIYHGVQKNIELALILLESIERHYWITWNPIISLCVVSATKSWQVLEWKEHDIRVWAIFQAHQESAPLNGLIIQTRVEDEIPKISLEWTAETMEPLRELLQKASWDYAPWPRKRTLLILRPEGNLQDGTSDA